MPVRTDLPTNFVNRLNELVNALTQIEEREHAKKWKTQADIVRWEDGPKWIKINFCGDPMRLGSVCGAWLVERTTGELYNIKGYGVPDKNKKIKSDLGNVMTVDPEFLWRNRYNYLNHFRFRNYNY